YYLAPLMCAGITTYSPLRQFGCKPGDQVAVVGLGGLGHMAVKLAASTGAEVTVLSTSRDKEKDASRLGAKHFVATKEPGALEALQGRFSLIMDTVSAPHDLNTRLTLLRNFGTMVLVGLPPSAAQLDAFTLVHGNRRIAGSNIGGFRRPRRCLTIAGRMESLPMSKSSKPTRSMTRTSVWSGVTCVTASSSMRRAWETSKNGHQT